MIWKPSTRQLETLAELGRARAPASKIAAAPEEFSAWAGRLVAARAAGPVYNQDSF